MASSASAIIDLDDADLQFTETMKPGGGPSGGHDQDLGGGGTTHTFGRAPDSALDDEDDDRTGLLDGEKQKRYNFWSVEFYQQFFDVDTDEVGARIKGAMLPVPGRSFLADVTKRRPDLYGPFWICATLVVSVAVTGNLASYLQAAWHTGGKDFEWHYDFHKVTLAATAVFSYAWLVPAGLYAFLWWTASGALTALSFLDLICLYGYSLAIYIPVSVLWLIQYSVVQWTLVLLGAGLSGAVIVMTLYPVFKESATKSSVLLVAVIVGLHLLLACGFMLYFFHVPPSYNDENAAANPASPAPVSKVPEAEGGKMKEAEKKEQLEKRTVEAAGGDGNGGKKDFGVGDGGGDVEDKPSGGLQQGKEENKVEEQPKAAALTSQKEISRDGEEKGPKVDDAIKAPNGNNESGQAVSSAKEQVSSKETEEGKREEKEG